MFKPIPTPTPSIVAFDAIGKITDEDYKSVLIPALEQAIKEHGNVRALLRFGPEFDGYTARAAFDDTVFGIGHLRDFDRIAVASDEGWIRNGVSMFAHLSTVPIRVFDADQTDAALAWLAET